MFAKWNLAFNVDDWQFDSFRDYYILSQWLKQRSENDDIKLILEQDGLESFFLSYFEYFYDAAYRTPLGAAILDDDADLTNYLLQKGANPCHLTGLSIYDATCNIFMDPINVSKTLTKRTMEVRNFPNHHRFPIPKDIDDNIESDISQTKISPLLLSMRNTKVFDKVLPYVKKADLNKLHHIRVRNLNATDDCFAQMAKSLMDPPPRPVWNDKINEAKFFTQKKKCAKLRTMDSNHQTLFSIATNSVKLVMSKHIAKMVNLPMPMINVLTSQMETLLLLLPEDLIVDPTTISQDWKSSTSFMRVIAKTMLDGTVQVKIEAQHPPDLRLTQVTIKLPSNETTNETFEEFNLKEETELNQNIFMGFEDDPGLAVLQYVMSKMSKEIDTQNHIFTATFSPQDIINDLVETAEGKLRTKNPPQSTFDFNWDQIRAYSKL